MTYVKTHLLTLKTRVENLKRNVWLWSRDPLRVNPNLMTTALRRYNGDTTIARLHLRQHLTYR